LLTKADFWAYEEEWRIIKYPPSQPGLKAFPADSLDGIILGAKISASDRAEVSEWARRKNRDIDLLEAIFDDKDYRLNAMPFI
jgi:hypothetical protein